MRLAASAAVLQHGPEQPGGGRRHDRGPKLLQYPMGKTSRKIQMAFPELKK
jgi:hypothetical protein